MGFPRERGQGVQGAGRWIEAEKTATGKRAETLQRVRNKKPIDSWSPLCLQHCLWHRVSIDFCVFIDFRVPGVPSSRNNAEQRIRLGPLGQVGP